MGRLLLLPITSDHVANTIEPTEWGTGVYVQLELLKLERATGFIKG